MTLDEVCSAFEGLFGSVKVDPKLAGAMMICSGAIGQADRPPPVLCATEALAAELWRRTAFDAAIEWLNGRECLVDERGTRRQAREDDLRGFVLTWEQEPRTLRLNMSIQEQGGGHRVASTRYAVYSLCAFTEKPQDVATEQPPASDAAPLGRARKARRKASR